MKEPNAPRIYGVRVGLVAAVFSIAQALVLYGAALGGYAGVHAIQQAINIINSIGPVVDVGLLLPAVLPMLIISYGSMIVAGVVTALLARQAGRVAAIRTGRHSGGARAGMWVWLISSVVWIAASVIVVALAHMDGTVSGIFTGTGKPEFTGQEILFLVIQEIAAALVGLGVCALSGARGAASATLVEPALAPVAGFYPFAPYQTPWGAPPTPGYPTPYQARPQPPAGYPAYPGAMYPAQQPWTPQPGVYPPPPSHYLPQPAPAAPAAPTTPEPPASDRQTAATPGE